MKMLIVLLQFPQLMMLKLLLVIYKIFYPYLSSSLDLTISLLKMLNDNCNHLTQLLKWAQTYNRYEKVAAFLYDLSKDNNKEKNLLFGRIPYTHQEIADSLAISRVTVTKVLNQFKEEGLIDIQYGHIQVLERQKTL